MQCSVCYEPFDIRERRPKIVPCGHTFCLQCLTLFQTNECPTCRTEFRWPPNDLTDNFLALEETADMKFVQRAMWCETCCDAPRVECIEKHDVCSSRTAQSRLEGELVAALRAEQRALGRDRDARARMVSAVGLVLDSLEEQADEANAAVAEELRLMTRAGCRSPAGGNGGVKAAKMAIRTSENRAAALQEALSVLDGTEAVLKVKCGGRWRSFSVDLTEEEPQPPQPAADEQAQAQAQAVSGTDACRRDRSRLLMYVAYALTRRPLPGMRQSSTFVVRLAVKAPRLEALPDVVVEFDEMPSRQNLLEAWGKGWRRYSICRSCLESVHTQAFTPQPPEAEEAAIERGALCVGRSSGKFYFILCNDMRAKFCLPLTANFRVVGRVVENLSSLDEAVKSTIVASDTVRIVPKL